MPIEEEPKPYDEDIIEADKLVNVDPGNEYAAAYSTQAQAYALISIARTLRRLELLLPSLR